MKRFLLAALLGAAVLSPPASAATFAELEANDTLGSAQSLLTSDTSITVNGDRIAGVANSADYFSFTVNAGNIVDLFVSATTPADSDMILSLYDGTSVLLGFSDDFNGFLPGIDQYEFLIGGTYYVAVGDVGDAGTGSLLSGGGADSYSYQLQINVNPIPEPSSVLGLLGLGVGGFALRRKRISRRQA